MRVKDHFIQQTRCEQNTKKIDFQPHNNDRPSAKQQNGCRTFLRLAPCDCALAVSPGSPQPTMHPQPLLRPSSLAPTIPLAAARKSPPRLPFSSSHSFLYCVLDRSWQPFPSVLPTARLLWTNVLALSHPSLRHNNLASPAAPQSPFVLTLAHPTSP